MDEEKIYKIEFKANRYTKPDGSFEKSELGSCYVLSKNHKGAIRTFENNSSQAWKMHSICHLISVIEIQEELFIDPNNDN